MGGGLANLLLAPDKAKTSGVGGDAHNVQLYYLLSRLMGQQQQQPITASLATLPNSAPTSIPMLAGQQAGGAGNGQLQQLLMLRQLLQSNPNLLMGAA